MTSFQEGGSRGNLKNTTHPPACPPAPPAIRPGYRAAVHELLSNIKRTCERGRAAAQTESNLLATCDHIENLADEALSYFDEHEQEQDGFAFRDPRRPPLERMPIQLDYELLARMLEAGGDERGVYTPEAVAGQIRLLRAVAEYEAAGVHTARRGGS